MSLVLVALVIAALVAVVMMFWITAHVVGLALYLLMAGAVGALADAVVPGRLPYGWLGAVLAGIVGSWLGVLLIPRFGPHIFGFPVVPGFVGAVILAFGLQAVSRLQARQP
jgi:uncharacterized membrane protein YeaQ/YmgE (transglycosylase-associated protein family)